MRLVRNATSQLLVIFFCVRPILAASTPTSQSKAETEYSAAIQAVESAGGECEGDVDCDWGRSFAPLIDFIGNYPGSSLAQKAIARLNATLDGYFLPSTSGEQVDPFADWSRLMPPVNYQEHKALVQKYDDAIQESWPKPLKVLAYKRLAWYYLGYKNSDRAKQLYKSVLILSPNDPDKSKIQGLLNQINSTRTGNR